MGSSSKERRAECRSIFERLAYIMGRRRSTSWRKKVTAFVRIQERIKRKDEIGLESEVMSLVNRQITMPAEFVHRVPNDEHSIETESVRLYDEEHALPPETSPLFSVEIDMLAENYNDNDEVPISIQPQGVFGRKEENCQQSIGREESEKIPECVKSCYCCCMITVEVCNVVWCCLNVMSLIV